MSERLTPKVCEQCSAPFDGRKPQRFCSRTCSARHNNNIREATPRTPAEACHVGHRYTADNTFTAKDGRRICRQCKRNRERDTRRRNGKRPAKPRTVKAAAPAVVVPTVLVARPVWRPTAPGWQLRPGDAGYQDVAS